MWRKSEHTKKTNSYLEIISTTTNFRIRIYSIIPKTPGFHTQRLKRCPQLVRLRESLNTTFLSTTNAENPVQLPKSWMQPQSARRVLIHVELRKSWIQPPSARQVHPTLSTTNAETRPSSQELENTTRAKPIDTVKDHTNNGSSHGMSSVPHAKETRAHKRSCQQNTFAQGTRGPSVEPEEKTRRSACALRNKSPGNVAS